MLANVRDAVSIDISTEALCIHDCFAEGVTVPLALVFGVGIPTEVVVTVEIVAMIVSEAVVPVSHGIDLWSCVMIDVLTGTVISTVPFGGANVLAGVDLNT